MKYAKYVLFVVGFLVAVTPTMFRNVWDGQSLLGLLMVLGALGWMILSVPEEVDDV